MNLFALDIDPIQAARYNCNIHCNKMFLEVTQMLTNCFPENVLPEMPPTKQNTCRKYSHYNHPTSKWVRANKNNLEWTITHAMALEEERLIRGYNPHFTSTCFNWIVDNTSKMIFIPSSPLTDIPPAIKEDKECRKRIINFDNRHFVEQYMLYYVFDKPFAAWSTRETPEWFIQMKSKYHIN